MSPKLKYKLRRHFESVKKTAEIADDCSEMSEDIHIVLTQKKTSIHW